MKVLTLIESGRVAHEVLSQGAGTICAIFRRSVYLHFPGDRYACLGDAALGRGPINGIVLEGHLLPSLRLGDRIEIRFGNEVIWSPTTRVGRKALADISPGNLRSLELAAARRIPREGLGGGLIGGTSPLLKKAAPALRALHGWLGAARAPLPRARGHGLLGLGPGLTPSGDDYLAGVLVALRAIGEDATADRLWDDLRSTADRRTNAISRAHLRAAAAGEAHEALHLCLEQLFGESDAQWDYPLARLDAVGHCSGWDGLAGAGAVARSALYRRRTPGARCNEAAVLAAVPE